VAEEVKASLRVEKAQQLAYEKAMDAYNINRKEGSLEKAAAANGLKVEETPLFDQKGNIAPFGQAPDLIGSAFTLQAGEMARPINLPQEVVLFAVKERQESRLPQLNEVSDAVEQAFRQKKAGEMAQKSAETALAAVRKGTSLEAIARGQQQKVEETGFVTRSYGNFLPGLGNSEEIAKAAFALTPQKPSAEKVFEENGNFVVIQLKGRQETNMSGLDQNKREELRAALLSKQKSQAVEKQLQELRDKAEISISPTIASTLQGENS
jgi:peptidyl-prolyl cis-trans isomerase D